METQVTCVDCEHRNWSVCQHPIAILHKPEDSDRDILGEETRPWWCPLGQWNTEEMDG